MRPRFYPGVREALDRLHAADVAMAVLTNKPVRFSMRLLEGLGLEMHFFRVYGGNSFEEKKPHPRGIDLLMQESGADRSRTVMVGDSAVDVLHRPECGRAGLRRELGISAGDLRRTRRPIS